MLLRCQQIHAMIFRSVRTGTRRCRVLAGSLDHATWNGWTPTDLIFPFLLFAMGAAVPAARRKRHRDGLHGHVIRRALILFGLGLLLNVVEASPAAHAWLTLPPSGRPKRIAISIGGRRLVAPNAHVVQHADWRLGD